MTQVANMAEWTSLHAKAGNKAVDSLHDRELAETYRDNLCTLFKSRAVHLYLGQHDSPQTA